MSFTFYIVYQALEWLASVTGLTYKEINIVVYYGLVPLLCFALIDKILGKPFCLAGFSVVVAAFWLLVDNKPMFAERLFDGSARFLQGFAVLGINYDLASILICVLVPLFVLFVLLYLAFRGWFRRHLPTVSRIMDGPKR